MSEAFQSEWAQQLDAFVRFKHALGQQYQRPIAALRSFDRFAAAGPQCQPGDFEVLLKAWLHQSTNCTARTIRSYLAPVRQFCLFRRRYDLSAFVPCCSLAGPFQQSHYLPHILSANDIRRIVGEIPKHVKMSARNRRCYRILLIVLYCTGVRLGEALALRRRDLDLDTRCFRIGPSKGRIRWVPFHRDLARELRTWLEQDCHDTRLDAFVFARDDGQRRDVTAISDSLRNLFRRCGLKPPRGRRGPRVHDLRHAMAVHCLRRWYRQGRDVQRMLPWLSAYLGHRNLLGTERYLHATPELLALAARRLQQQLHHASAPS